MFIVQQPYITRVTGPPVPITPPRRLVKRVRSTRPPAGTRFKKVRRRLPVPALVAGSPARPTVVNNYYYGTQSRKTMIPRDMKLDMPRSFTQWYRPSATSFQISSTTGSYAATKGLLLGPTDATPADMFFSLKFRITDLNQVSTFKSMFDSYRIDHVEVEFKPAQNVMTGQSLDPLFGSNQELPAQNLVTVIDYDDADLPTSEALLEEFESYKMTGAYEPHVRKLTPAVAMNAYRTGGLTIGYVQRFKQWIDIDSTEDAEHYGIKGCLRSVNHGQGWENYRCGWYVRVKMCFSMRQKS